MISEIKSIRYNKSILKLKVTKLSETIDFILIIKGGCTAISRAISDTLIYMTQCFVSQNS